MNGYGLDTSVVLRLLIGEPAAQATRAAEFVQRELAGGSILHVSNLVLSETYFALQSYYGMTKTDAIQSLALLAGQGTVAFSPAALAVLNLPGLANAKPGMVDRLIHAGYAAGDMALLTFEKAGGRLPSTIVL